MLVQWTSMIYIDQQTKHKMSSVRHQLYLIHFHIIWCITILRAITSTLFYLIYTLPLYRNKVHFIQTQKLKSSVFLLVCSCVIQINTKHSTTIQCLFIIWLLINQVLEFCATTTNTDNLWCINMVNMIIILILFIQRFDLLIQPAVALHVLLSVTQQKV